MNADLHKNSDGVLPRTILESSSRQTPASYPFGDPSLPPTTPVGGFLFWRRLSRVTSKADLAAKVGLTPTTIRFWERGRGGPSRASAAKLAAALGVDDDAFAEYVVTVRMRHDLRSVAKRLDEKGTTNAKTDSS